MKKIFSLLVFFCIILFPISVIASSFQDSVSYEIENDNYYLYLKNNSYDSVIIFYYNQQPLDMILDSNSNSYVYVFPLMDIIEGEKLYFLIISGEETIQFVYTLTLTIKKTGTMDIFSNISIDPNIISFGLPFVIFSLLIFNFYIFSFKSVFKSIIQRSRNEIIHT